MDKSVHAACAAQVASFASSPSHALQWRSIGRNLAGIRQTMNPSEWSPNGEVTTITERTAWMLGGRFIMLRSYDGSQKLLSLGLLTWNAREKSYHYWHFAPDVYGGQWGVKWDDISREFHWRATDMPAGWIGTGIKRWIDDNTFENQTLIKDDQGRVLMDLQQKKKRGD